MSTIQDTFILRLDFFPQVKMLNREQRGDLLTAIFAYSAGEELPELDAVTAMCFGFIRASLDANAERYQARCDKNRENGGRGGRPTKNRTVSEKTDRLLEKANGFSENPIDSDLDSDSDSDSDLDSESLSLRDGAAAGREREDFLKILFFEKNILRPQVELERFTNHYAKCGWVDAHGNRIRDRGAALRAWSPDKAATKVPARTCAVWREAYEAIRRADPQCDATTMLTDFQGLVVEGPTVYLVASDAALRDFLEDPTHMQALAPVLKRRFNSYNCLVYRVKRNE